MTLDELYRMADEDNISVDAFKATPHQKGVLYKIWIW